jgi:hypothetical protein
MSQHRFDTVPDTYVVRIGHDLYPIYGHDACGWSIDRRDLLRPTATQFRYESLDEIVFALVNLHLSVARASDDDAPGDGFDQ